MAKKPPPGKCVHCCKSVPELTWDHVFPLSWYPDSTPDDLEKWKVPSCVQCNNELSRLEGNLLSKIGLCLPPDGSEVAGLVHKALRAIKPEFGRDDRDAKLRAAKRQRILRETRFGHDIPNHALLPNFDQAEGVPEERRMGLFVSVRDLEKLCDKITRGITYIADNAFIEEPYTIELCMLDYATMQTIDGILNRFGKVYERGPGIRILRTVPPEDAKMAVISIEIWRRLKMYSFVQTPE